MLNEDILDPDLVPAISQILSQYRLILDVLEEMDNIQIMFDTIDEHFADTTE